MSKAVLTASGATVDGSTGGTAELPMKSFRSSGKGTMPAGPQAPALNESCPPYDQANPSGTPAGASTAMRAAKGTARPTTGAGAPVATGSSSIAGQVRQTAVGAAGALQQQRSDRLVAFLATLVTYPFMFLLTKNATTVSVTQMAGVRGGGGIDTRKRLADFPEGAALTELESWCREPIFTSWVYEMATKVAVIFRSLLLYYLPNTLVLQVMNHPWVLRTLQISPERSLQQRLTDYWAHGAQLLAEGAPHAALRELQPLIDPSLLALKGRLEERVKLSRGPTPLERLDFLTYMARTASRLFFAWLRGLARLCTYVSSLLSVVSGALSFTVVPSIILSVFSAMLGVVQLLLMGTADLLEPAVNGVLALTESSKDTAAALGGSPESSPVGCRVLPASTVEQLELFFDKQLKQESGLLNRPEIPHLASLNRPLLVKAYDLGLIDARGRTETRVIAEMLAAAESMSLSHVLLRGLSRAALAATSFDVPGLLVVLQQTAEGAAGNLLPSFLGGGHASLRQLFRLDGFFAYADDRMAQVATVLLARLLSWLHLTQVVCPGSPDCLRFVLVMGERQAGKASLFSRLVAAPPEYAAQLGGGAEGLDGTTDMGAQAKLTAATAAAPATTASSSRSKSSPASTVSTAHAPAVDMQQLAGRPNTYVVVVPGLHSADDNTRKMAQSLAATLGSLASAVVFLVHPSSEPSPNKLKLLVPALAAGCHCLVAINGPSRVDGLAARPAANPSGAIRTSAVVLGVSPTPSQPSPLESLRGRWQSAAEALCAQQGLNPSLLGVIVSEVVEAEGVGELPAGVQHFRQVQDWVATTSTQAHRMV